MALTEPTKNVSGLTDENDDPVTDFTDVLNKDLPPKLVKRRKKAKREGYVDKDLDGKPDKDTFNIEDVETQWAKDLIDSVPELKQLFEDAAEEGLFDPASGATGQKRFESRVQDSKWFKENSLTARQMMALEQTDPGQFAELLETEKMRVIAQGSDLGFPISDANATNLARQSLMGNWMGEGRGQKLNDALMNMAGADALAGMGGALGDSTSSTGSMGEYVRTLRDTAAMNGISFDDGYYNDLARSALTGLTQIDDSIAEIREQAAGLWPPYAEKIRAGYNARDLASSYIQNMASVLQIDPQSISLDDPYIQGSITAFDDQGNPRSKSLWEQSNDLRKDPRWIESNDGQNKVASAISGVTAMFGITN
jgi:hypothetical protein